MMATNDSVRAPETRRFEYPSGSSFLWRYLPVAIGLGFVYAVLAHYGARPLSGFWFPLIVGIVVFDLVVTLVLRARSPQCFRFDGSKLGIAWADESLTYPVDEVAIRRSLSWILSSGVVITVGGKTFAVFRDLKGFDDFLSAIR